MAKSIGLGCGALDRFGKPAIRADDRIAERLDRFLQIERDQHLVLDDHHLLQRAVDRLAGAAVSGLLALGRSSAGEGVLERNSEVAIEPFRLPVEARPCRPAAAPRRRRWPRCQTAALSAAIRRAPPCFLPADDELVPLHLPADVSRPDRRRQRAILCGVGGKLVQRQRQRLRGRGIEQHIGAIDEDPARCRPRSNGASSSRSRPARSAPSQRDCDRMRVHARQRQDAALRPPRQSLPCWSPASAAPAPGPAPAHSWRGDRPRGQAAPAVLVGLALGDVEDDAADMGGAVASFSVEAALPMHQRTCRRACGCGTRYGALRRPAQLDHHLVELRPVVAMDQRAEPPASA